MVEYYKLYVPVRSGGSSVYLALEDNKLKIVADDGLSFDNSALVQITKEDLQEALKKLDEVKP